ncbi:MAG: HAD family hydrolase [Dehalococcoidales bacterium]|nr:HAD family hydrolase [Dehalococcoidales bacterium]
MHRRNTPFPDAVPFLRAAGKKYPICLSIDCDLEMITSAREMYPFDKIFVSKELRAYKFDPRFFRQVISHYDLKPENILHIGDSRSDIVKPRQLGIISCWLNRENKKWSDTVQPDFAVRSLGEVLEILDFSRCI